VIFPRTTLITLWAVPRSVSTAFEKSFSRHPEAVIVHEPFTDCYYFGSDRRSSRYGDRADRSEFDAQAALTSIFTESAPVTFVKDLCFQAEPYVPHDFLEDAVNTFIVRSPDDVLASLSPLKPDFTEDEFGFVPLAKMWHRIVDDLGREPIVIDGNMFRAYPEQTLRLYCERTGVSFDPGMLQWQDGRIREWSRGERDSQAKWHRTLEHSTGILPPSHMPSEVTISIDPDVYRRAREIYAMVSEHCLRPGSAYSVPD
jgi:hypothetical protein